jgi:prepilin peptidase CpaA
MQHILNKPTSLICLCLIAFVIAAAVSDTTRHRIPNALTVTAAALALLTNFLASGWAGALTSVAGLFAGLALFLPFYLARGFSAGDVKAMTAVGAFLGPKGALLAAAWILVFGAVGAIVLLVSVGGRAAATALLQRWSARAWILISAGTLARIAPPPNDAASLRFPYGIAIACGTLVSLAWS